MCLELRPDEEEISSLEYLAEHLDLDTLDLTLVTVASLARKWVVDTVPEEWINVFRRVKTKNLNLGMCIFDFAEIDDLFRKARVQMIDTMIHWVKDLRRSGNHWSELCYAPLKQL